MTKLEGGPAVSGCRGPYEGDPFDFVAAYLIPENLWYIIPEEMIRGQGSIAVYPRLKKSKYGRYREAWHLLGGGPPRDARIDSMEACAEEVEWRNTPAHAEFERGIRLLRNPRLKFPLTLPIRNSEGLREHTQLQSFVG